jgi:predicted Zn-dependent protease
MRMGRTIDARDRFDAVIAFDSGNATALRGRAELKLRYGSPDAALMDAQKLVTISPNSADARLLLARCYTAADKVEWADRTLWAAFQDIPANEDIFTALAARRKSSSEATAQLKAEFARQLDAQVNRGVL